ncbi:MAG TPA: hypothetical protein VMB23_10540, partial [Spirochaetia bacterium]|nr:hypothetical protein [Spirochaetia bacterium]
MDGSNLVFVLSGLETASVPSLALPVLTAYLDIPIGASTPEVAALAIQKFLKKVSTLVPVDHYSQDGKGWWKVEIPQADWANSRTQLLALLQEQNIDPSVALENVADDLLRQGKYADAITGYVTAAAAAVSDGHPAQPGRFKTNLAKAQDVVSRLTLASATPSLSTQVGQGFPAPFDIRLTYGAGTQAPVVPGVPLRFNYKAKKNGRLASTGQSVKTDADGKVSFDLPVPDFAARDNLVVLVDVTPWLDLLASVPRDFKDQLDSFANSSGERRLQLPYTVISASKQIPLVVALADFDDRGGVERRQETTSSLISALQRSGFQASGIPVNPTLLKSTNDNVVLAAWKFQGKTTGRAVFGTVSLVSVTANGSQFSAEVAGSVKIADLATSKPVYQLKSSKVSSAADKTSAVTLAFRQWAE